MQSTKYSGLDVEDLVMTASALFPKLNVEEKQPSRRRQRKHGKISSGIFVTTYIFLRRSIPGDNGFRSTLAPPCFR